MHSIYYDRNSLFWNYCYYTYYMSEIVFFEFTTTILIICQWITRFIMFCSLYEAVLLEAGVVYAWNAKLVLRKDIPVQLPHSLTCRRKPMQTILLHIVSSEVMVISFWLCRCRNRCKYRCKSLDKKYQINGFQLLHIQKLSFTTMHFRAVIFEK